MSLRPMDEVTDDFLFAADYIRSQLQSPDLSSGFADAFGGLGDLIAAVAENLLAALLASVEARALRDFSNRIDTGLAAGHRIPERFLWESAAQTLLGAGHRAANCALRLGVLDESVSNPPRRLEAVVALLRRCEPPLSDDRNAWISESTAASVADWLASSSHESVTAVGSALRAWVEAAGWTHLVSLRGRTHHRWRPPTGSDPTEQAPTHLEEAEDATLRALTDVAPPAAALCASVMRALGDLTDDTVGLRRFPVINHVMSEEAEDA